MEKDLLGLAGALKHTEKLAIQANQKTHFDIEGVGLFTEKNLKPVVKFIPKREQLHLTNLNSLIQLVKQESNVKGQIIINVSSPTQVSAYGPLDVNHDREELYQVRAQVPDIVFNRFISVEEMIIQLQTNFEESENKSNLIQNISKLSKNQSIDIEDDGVSQSVVQSDGVTAGKVTLPPLIKLIPQRSFYEVEQPEQMFLIRIDNSANVALYDASGGAWKNDITVKVVAMLKEELHTEITNGGVVVA